jgi:predicted TIM-barrel fold metal-dependent hydrolase
MTIGIGRRELISALGVIAAWPITARAQARNPRRIDVHHHILPPHYLAAAREHLLGVAVGYEQALQWTPEASLAQMDKYGIATAVTSNPSPWTWFAPDDARHLVRDSNEYAAQLRRDHPGRFGMFASLPMPDIDGSLAEIDYAFGSLTTDGICLTTSYGDKWPGHPSFEPVFAELNRRKAVVFVHPASPNCCRGLVTGVPDPTLEFMFDITRCITSLLFSGTFSRLPDIRFIFTHAGGTVAQLGERIVRNAAIQKGTAERLPNGALYELQRLHYDITTSTSRPTLAALKELVPLNEIVFGSDYPYLPVALTVEGLERFSLAEADLDAINRGNAAALFPPFAG